MNERDIAVSVLTEITEEQIYNNIALRRTLKRNNGLSGVKKAFITEIVNGTLRNIIYIDYVIDLFSSVKTKKMKSVILNILRISVYQILFMDKTPKGAACNEAVKISKMRGYKGLSGFVNGILRNIARNSYNIYMPDKNKEPIQYLSIKYSYPKWIIEYWLKNIDYSSVENMCLINNKPPKVCICVNSLNKSYDNVYNTLIKEGVETKKGNDELSIYISKQSDITALNSFQSGFYHVIDESSMFAVRKFMPKKGERIADICSAPGGKSFMCAYLMDNSGFISSRDIYEHKIKLIEEGAKRLKINIIKAELKNAEKFYKEDEETFDRVLIDAPCSGFGIIRKKPDIKYTKSIEDIYSLAKLQRNIFDSSWKYVKKNGIILYSTCTVSKIENEDNTEYFTNNYPVELIEKKQLMPAESGGDGFFWAVFRRKD